MFKKFGVVILRNQTLINKDQLQVVIMLQLTGGNEVSLKKKACYAMGSFAFILNNQQLGALVSDLLKRIEANAKKQDTTMFVQCLSLIAKTTGTKLTPFLA